MHPLEESITFFKRKEKKFIIDSKTFSNLKEIFDGPNSNFKTDHLDKETDFTFIENIYFDSPDLNSYHQSLKGDENRFKLRLRKYAQDFKKADDRIFFEIKSKENGETVKKRVAFKSEWLDSFLKNGNFPEGEFALLNSDKKPQKSLKIIGLIYDLIKDLKYRPVLTSNYIRYAYKLKGSKSIRITIDRDLNFKSLVNDLPVLIPYQESIQKHQYIVEIKYLADELLLEISNVIDLLGQSNKFSKYSYGIYQAFINKKAVLLPSKPHSKKLPKSSPVFASGHLGSY